MKYTALFALVLASSSAWAADRITEPPMVTIPGGTFTMGDSSATPRPPQPFEQPVHEVRIAPFQMAQYEVTVAQFRQFIAATGHKTESMCWQHAKNEWGMDPLKGSWDAPGYPSSDFHPVMCVSWKDARAYAAWLAASTGKAYRLPSEAEWEYAARAGSPAKYHFGADEAQVCRYGNIRDTVGRVAIGKITGKEGKEAACSDGAGFTSIVGMYEPNAFGLYDMIGNVGEIVEDCDHANYEGAPRDGSAWSANCLPEMKIHRGGNFGSRSAASTMRGHTGEANASALEGFRVALGSPGPVLTSAGTRAFQASLKKLHAAERARRAGR